MVEATPVRSGFSREEYTRRWRSVVDRFGDFGVDAVAVTSPANIEYFTAVDGGPYWPTPLIIPDDRVPTFVVRLSEQDRVRRESPVDRIVSYFGEDEAIDVWADAVKSLGLERARLGLELDRWGLAPADVEALRSRLPGLRITDISNMVSQIVAIKSDEEVAVMRQAMGYTEVGVAAFFESLVEGASETEILLADLAALLGAGSGMPWFMQVSVGARSAIAHAPPSASARLSRGDVGFTEQSGVCEGYYAPLVRTAILGRNGDAERLHRIAEDAQQAAIDTIRPGALTGDVDAASRDVLERAGVAGALRHRVGYNVGLGWTTRGRISLKPNGRDVIQEGMTFHIPTILFDGDRFAVGVSETVVVRQEGAEPLGRLPRQIRLL